MCSADVREILVLHLDHSNQLPQAFPALRRLKKSFSNAKIRILCSSTSKNLAILEPMIDSIVTYDYFDILDLVDTKEKEANLSQTLLPFHFDIAIDLCPQPNTRELLKLSGANLFAGFDFENRFPWLQIALEWEGDTRLRGKRDPMVIVCCNWSMHWQVGALMRRCLVQTTHLQN